MKTPKEQMLKISLCMINYNGEKYLKESLGSVIIQRKKFTEILLIDNASGDRSLEIIKKNFSEIKIVKLSGNYGPAKARNIGFKLASSDLILFMDNDVSLGLDCPEILIKALIENPYATIAMPRILHAHKPNIIQYEGADCHFLGLTKTNNENLDIKKTPCEIREIGSVITACFLMDRKKWQGNDPFDPNFFIYLEDLDFGLRSRLLGHKILSVPSAYCFHREGTQGLSLRALGYHSKMRIFYHIRNRWQLILKNYAVRTLIFCAPVLFIYELIQIIAVLKKGWLYQWFKAFCWIFMHRLDILRQRSIIQNTRKTSDSEILINGPLPFTVNLIRSPLEKAGMKVINQLTINYWELIKKLI